MRNLTHKKSHIWEGDQDQRDQVREDNLVDEPVGHPGDLGHLGGVGGPHDAGDGQVAVLPPVAPLEAAGGLGAAVEAGGGTDD